MIDQEPCARCGASCLPLLTRPPLYLCDACGHVLVARLADQHPDLQFPLDMKVDLHRARLDELWHALYAISTDESLPGDVRIAATNEALTVLDQQANLYGLYAPDETAAEMRRLTGEMERRARPPDEQEDDE